MRRILISLTALTLLLAPQLTFGADVDDLKAAFEKMVQALNAKDIDAIVANYHDKAVGALAGDAFHTDHAPVTGEQFRTAMAAMMANVESSRIIPINMQYRVFGNVGIVWGNSRSNAKPKDGPAEKAFGIGTMTWIKEGGKWVIVAYHVSPLSSGN